MYIVSVFPWGSRSARNYFSNVKPKAVASYSRKVNGKKKFFEKLCLISKAYNFVFAEFRSILVIAGDVFDVSNVPFERSPEVAISGGAASGALVAIV